MSEMVSTCGFFFFFLFVSFVLITGFGMSPMASGLISLTAQLRLCSCPIVGRLPRKRLTLPSYPSHRARDDRRNPENTPHLIRQ